VSEPKVIYEDKNFMAVLKPAGYLTHHVGQGKEDSAPALTDWLIKKYPGLKKVGDLPLRQTGLPAGGQTCQPERPGVVHRLDKDTSGVMLVPKNQKYFEYLKSLFKTHAIKKTYLALVWGVPKERRGRVDVAIGIRSGTIRRQAGGGKMQKPAVTEYSVKEIFKDKAGESFALLEARPLTGRTHQIRVHLKHIGHPIVGDPIYGRKIDKPRRPPGIGAPTKASGGKQLMLHAFGVEFEIKPGKPIKIEAEPPEDFRRTLSNLTKL
jgi:23S rRNA pseudouridine1911/1915/1917 synthase